MKKIIMLTFVLVCIIPSVLLCFFDISDAYPPENPMIDSTTVPEAIIENPTQPEDIYVTVLNRGKIENLPLEEYIFSVVLAEMPADFELEALKAQAVVARTYTCKKIKNSKHQNADVCTDSSCCQAYMDVATYRLSGGTEEKIRKIRTAVEDTAGKVLVYQGELIEATYFSCSGGKTEDAAAVWGSDLPYLQSVSSPGEEHAAHYTDTVSFSVTEFCKLLGLNVAGNPGKWIENISYTNGGGVEAITVQGISFSGTEIRRKLGLRSTAFVITVAGNRVTITTKGFGHRVGMSQYGADAMAVQGSNYQEILLHYYSGTSLSDLSG